MALSLCSPKKLNKPFHAKKLVSQIVINICILFFLFMSLLPLYMLLIKSVKTIEQDQMNPFVPTVPLLFDNYRVAWLNISGYMFNSLFLTVVITVGSLIIISITTYPFVRFRFPFKEAIFIAFLALMMIPGSLTLVSQYMLVNTLGLVDSYFGVILPSLAGCIPMNVFLLRTFFGGVSKELFDASKIDGAGDFVTLWKIMVPLSTPILATIGISQFMGIWNEYIWARLVLLNAAKQTITIGLISFTDQHHNMTGSYGAPFAGYVISAVPLIIIFAIGSKQFISGLTSGAFKF